MGHSHTGTGLNSEASPSTSTSLLQRVKTQDPRAWEKLCRVYGPLVYEWARAAGLQDQDAADVGQEVFRTVALAVVSQNGVNLQQSYL